MHCVAGTGCLGYPTYVDSTHYETDCTSDIECALPRLMPTNGGLADPF